MKYPEHICRFNDGKQSCECYDKALEELKKKIKRLAVKFSIRGSGEFDDGRLSMRREVLDIIENR